MFGKRKAKVDNKSCAQPSPMVESVAKLIQIKAAFNEIDLKELRCEGDACYATLNKDSIAVYVKPKYFRFAVLNTTPSMSPEMKKFMKEIEEPSMKMEIIENPDSPDTHTICFYKDMPKENFISEDFFWVDIVQLIHAASLARLKLERSGYTMIR